MTSSSSSSSVGVRSWRTAFLTLRDETLAKQSLSSISLLLRDLIFSTSISLIAASPHLPSHELTSDLLFLLQLVANYSPQQPLKHDYDYDDDGEDEDDFLTSTCQLVHDVSCRCSLNITSSSWTILLDSFRSIIIHCLPRPNASGIRPLLLSFHTIRRVISDFQRRCSLSDDIHLVKFLLDMVTYCHAELTPSYRASAKHKAVVRMGNQLPKHNSLWEVQTVAFNILGDVFSRSGSLVPVDVWRSTIEVLRKVMDVLAIKSVLIEDKVMSWFYESLLHCLHLVLVDPKYPLVDHLSSFVAALRMFFTYGLAGRSQLSSPPVVFHKEKEIGLTNLSLTSEEPKKKAPTAYRPPHLRRNTQQPTTQNFQNFSGRESSMVDFTSSDSDYSDGEGSHKDPDSIRYSKVRVAAIVCIQDLSQADSKSFTSQWTILLPTNDVLQPRRFEATLMTCLLFDPCLKARIASAVALAMMMDGPSSVFLQVAEYKESSRFGSFMALSSSLGGILMQLHAAPAEAIVAAPAPVDFAPHELYSRMPGDLLPTVIISLLARIQEGFPHKTDLSGSMVAALSCLTAALSTSPPSQSVKEMLLEEISTGSLSLDFVGTGKRSNILSILVLYSEQLTSPTICFEALQALRAVSHNYPNSMLTCWEQISAIANKIFSTSALDISSRAWQGQVGNNAVCEKVVTAATKVLDESLRAISGFKGTEDPMDDKTLDAPFTSDCIRIKKVSSAPSYVPESDQGIEEEPKTYLSGIDQWSEIIEKHMPLILHHTSATVRTASITCFAGITSFVLFSLKKEKQDFIISSVIDGALKDSVPSVRSAACRAIGVISCFPQISMSAGSIGRFIYAIETNTRDPLASVRITASWALANICDSVCRCLFPLDHCTGSDVDSQSVELLIECALRLAKDGDKIKSNAVRALGNLSRFVTFGSAFGMHDDEPLKSNGYHPSHLLDSSWLEKTVQAFLSCVTTGNVKDLSPFTWNPLMLWSNEGAVECVSCIGQFVPKQDIEPSKPRLVCGFKVEACAAVRIAYIFLPDYGQQVDAGFTAEDCQNLAKLASSVFSILLLLLRDSSNFKIRIQAAAALAVPSSVFDYGKSFSDIVQGVEHTLENLSSDRISAPSNFKYRDALEKQLTSTMLHVLGLASRSDHEPLKDFIIKKASFLEGWLAGLCSALGETSFADDNDFVGNQKKQMICMAVDSITEICKSRNQCLLADKFNYLSRIIQ
ncbi:hypothetical protein ACFE04_011928 [Oxalis oulophora]